MDRVRTAMRSGGIGFVIGFLLAAVVRGVRSGLRGGVVLGLVTAALAWAVAGSLEPVDAGEEFTAPGDRNADEY